MADLDPYWLESGGRDEDYEIDLDEEFEPDDPSTTILSQFLGEPAGEIDPVYAELLEDRGHKTIAKVVVNGVEYTDRAIIDFEIEDALTLGGELEIGTVIPSKLTLRVRDVPEFPTNARIEVYVALILGSTQSDWMPMGVYYVDNRAFIDGVMTYTCYDELVLSYVPYVSQLAYPATMQDVWDEICTLIGFTSDASVVINPSYTIPAGPAGFTCQQVLGFIASAHSACVRINRDGKIAFVKVSKNNTPVFDLASNEYVQLRQTNPIKRYSRVVVVYDMDDGLYYEAGSGAEHETLFVDNPYGTQAIANALLAEIGGLSYLPVRIPSRGIPHIERGDVLSVEVVRQRHVPEYTWDDADVAWEDADFPWAPREWFQTIALYQRFYYAGGLSMHIEAPSLGEQRSEFPIEGSLEQQVNRLARNAVRYNKSYYGITHSREQGIVIQREDGAAKAIFNADELTFYRGASKAVYFDPAAGVYKFNGTLEAANGVFSGSLSAATGTFAGSLQAASGTFAGALQAATGTFAGNLSAAGGTFAGSLQAATGTFAGSLSAATGTFAGSLSAATGTFAGALQGGTIQIGSGNNVFRADTNGIWAGHANYSSAPFRVSMSGDLLANSGSIGGWGIDSGFLYGGTLLGGILRGGEIETVAPGNYPRIAMSTSGNELVFEASATNYVKIYQVGPIFFLDIVWGSSIFSIGKGASATTIQTNDQLTLTNGSSSITITGNIISMTAPAGAFLNGNPL